MARLKELILENYDELKHKEDVLYIADNLRNQDKEELKACGYDNFLAVILSSLNGAGISFIVKSVDHKPLCVFGISSHKDKNLGTPIWFLSVDCIDEYRKEFIYYAGQVVKLWAENFGKLYNYVSVGNTKSMTWLKRLGAKFSKPIPYGANGDLFVRFTIGGDGYVR